ncbi:MAG: CPBP family intramembrane metalloprotease [Bifidobacteriaceae bacterium]|nr:CPBP family intramembrane metalloprotease [Bifidobacteriaceae bacterium]
MLLVLLGHLQFAGHNAVPLLAVWFLSALLNVVVQELLVRGYLFFLLEDRYGVGVATVATTILFVTMHGGAREAGFLAIVNVALTSVLLSLLLVYSGSLLAPIIAHFIWNSIGCLVLGIVPLAEDYPHLLNGILSGDALISGGAYGIEGGGATFLVTLLLTVLVGILARRQNRRRRVVARITAAPQYTT